MEIRENGTWKAVDDDDDVDRFAALFSFYYIFSESKKMLLTDGWNFGNGC